MPLNWDKLEEEFRLDSWIDHHIPVNQDFINLSNVISEDGRPKFITLLDGEESYRKLAVVTNTEIRFEILKSLNDIVFLTEMNIISNSDRKNILETENFRLGFMRRGSAYQAFHRGSRHIWASGRLPVSDSRIPFLFSCILEGFGSAPHTLDVQYVDTPVLEDRVHCLVGKNGCGKTRILREMVLNFAKKSHPEDNCLLDNFDSTSLETVEFDGPEFRRVLCFTIDPHTQFPTGTRSDSRFEYIYTNLSNIDINDSSTSSTNLTRLLVDIIRSNEPLDDSENNFIGSRRTLLFNAIRPYISIENLLIPLQDDAIDQRIYIDDTGKKWISLHQLKTLNEQKALLIYPYIKLDEDVIFTNNNRKIINLSSGHRAFFKFAVSFLSYIDIGTLVILDEPETHLHPNLICDFMNLLYEVLTATKSVALIATHSAYVVREVPTHCAHIYHIDDNGIPSENLAYLRTLGANVDNISHAIFGDSNAKKFHREIAKEIAASSKKIEKIISSYSEIMSPDLLSQISRLIEKDNEQTDENI